VEHDGGQGEERGMSFRNTWLRSVGVRLPTLALAVDDALIGFAERLACILGAPQAIPSQAAGDSRRSPQVPPAPPLSLTNPYNSATSPFHLLIEMS
jgi:hypothetical protein